MIIHRLSPRSIAQRIFPQTTPPRLSLFFFAILIQIISALLIALFEGVEWAHNAGIAIGFILLRLLSFLVILAIAKPIVDHRLRPYGRKLATGAMTIALFLIIAGIGEAAVMLPTFFSENAPSDRLALTQQGCQFLLDGENPYPQTNILIAIDEFPNLDPTPLREGDFAEVYPYPTEEQIEEAIAKAQANPEVPPLEFESKISYPAGSFLFPAPFAALGLDLRWFYLLCALAIVGVITWRAPAKLRLLAFVACLASVEMWNIVAAGSIDTLFILFLLLGWISRKRPWASAISYRPSMRWWNTP